MNIYFETHNHSTYSFLDGVSTPSDIAERAKLLGYPAVAITDHGEIAGWYEFYKACKAQEIQPIFGCEFYVAKDESDIEENPFKKDATRLKRGHLIIHAKGQDGLQAVIDLYNSSWLNYKEKGKKNIIYEQEILKQAGKIIIQSACLGSYIDDEEKLLRFKEVFKEDFYLEIQPHQLIYQFDQEKSVFERVENTQKVHNIKMIEWAKKFNIKLVVTSDAHYPTKEDKILQDILILNSYVGKKTGWYFQHDSSYLMDAQTWWEIAKCEDYFSKEDFEIAINNLHEIKDKCVGAVLDKKPSLRKFDLTSHPLYQTGDSAEKLVLRIIQDVGRYNKSPEYVDRFKREFEVIRKKGFIDYFLIQEDIIRWNKQQGYLVGPARGSAAGSLFSYYLDITKIDPLKYDLLFERFLDESRPDFPDIDIDYEMKEETVEYISNKYGKEYVMPIGAFQSVKLKTALKNAYRIMYANKGYDYDLVNQITKEIPESNARGEDDQLNIFKEILKDSKKEYEAIKMKGGTPSAHNLFAFLLDKPDLAKVVSKLLGKISNMRVHPCSIVISDKPITNVLPVTKSQPGTSSERDITAFDGVGVEASGYLKFDVLGLTTLNAIGACLKEIKKYKGNILECGIDISNPNNIWLLKPTDPEILEKTAKGDTATVFQVLQPLPRKLCMDMQVSDFNDWVASIALVRPGPLKAGFPKMYVDRKFGRLGKNQMYQTEVVKGTVTESIVPAKYTHPKMDELLKDTYGIIVYQEQVQKLFVAIGGFTPLESNSIRKAIAKGKKQLLFDSKPQFLEYATKKLDPPWTQEQVDAFYDDMIGFGSYCFNKSHSVAYALLGYICQYLKTKYPLEWWTGNLQHAGEKGTAKILDTIIEKNLAPIKTVDINKSKSDFFFDGQSIVMPMKYLKGIGGTCLEHIIKEQNISPFTSLENFVNRVPGRSVRRNAVVSLIITGAFNEIEPNKTTQELLKHYFFEVLKLKESDLSEEQVQLIDQLNVLEKKRSEVDPFYKSDWVNKFRSSFNRNIVSIENLNQYAEDATIYVGGEVVQVQFIRIKKGKQKDKKMAWLHLQQLTHKVKVTVWPDFIEKNAAMIDRFNTQGGLVEVAGKISKYRGEINIMADVVKEIIIK